MSRPPHAVLPPLPPPPVLLQPRKAVLVLGVGGVGKTTLIYRMLSLSLTPRVTIRPGVYRVYHNGVFYEVVDVPGQRALEVAQAAARQWRLYDRALLVYDLTKKETLEALGTIRDALCLFGKCLSAREVWLVGNKRDLAEAYGVSYEADPASLGADKLVKISAKYDPPEELAALLP